MKPSFLHLSIRQRLPLLICVLLLIIIFIYGIISYVGVKKASSRVGHERLLSLTEQLSRMLSVNAQSFISTTHAVGNESAVKKYLLSNGKDSIEKVSKLIEELRKDSLNVQVEIRNADKIPVLSSAKKGVQLDKNLDSALLVFPGTKPDLGRVGKLLKTDSFIYCPAIATITDQNRLIGYIVRWRKLSTTSQSVEQLSQLLGTGAKLYVGNADGSLWTDMMRSVPAPLIAQSNKNGIREYSTEKNVPVIASKHPIANSEWQMVIELSKKKIMEQADQTLYWLVITGVILLMAGIFAAWLMSRNISEPLRNLTTVTADIAEGNYTPLTEINRHDELGKLARAFNLMAYRVKSSQQVLENETRKYKLLFEKNPMPMWIIAKSTLDVIDVNDAAVMHYGYPRNEFLKLNAMDLRPEEDIVKYLEYLRKEAKGGTKSGTWRHKKKDGTIIMVDIVSDDIIYRDKPAILVVANDVTEKLKTEAELSRQFFLRQKLITETTIQAQEKEREEIGKELHDNINQVLAAAKLYLEVVLTGNPGLQKEATRKSYENVTLAISEIRQLSKQLVPPVLEETLSSTLKELASEIQMTSGILIRVEMEEFEEDLADGNIKLVFYRIVQEQINNIVKHAKAKNVIVKAETTFGYGTLIIVDDGIGFDTNKRSGGIGLRNMASRVKFYNGSLNIESQPGKGCTLEVSIPLKDEENLSASSA